MGSSDRKAGQIVRRSWSKLLARDGQLVGNMHEFAKQIEAPTKRMMVNTQQSQKLAALRDLLLPKLLSGEIRVAVAEKAPQAMEQRLVRLL